MYVYIYIYIYIYMYRHYRRLWSPNPHFPWSVVRVEISLNNPWITCIIWYQGFKAKKFAIAQFSER